jgi:hypothetical protein
MNHVTEMDIAYDALRTNNKTKRTMLKVSCLPRFMQFPIPNPQLYHTQGTWGTINEIV